jgi:hypothetical protein
MRIAIGVAASLAGRASTLASSRPLMTKVTPRG